jgi:hypothetical protein
MNNDEAVVNRVRGHYAKLICLNCRARKIKCQLSTAVEPSDQPQPHAKKCVRCRRHGLECVVDRTTLGRPAHKRKKMIPLSAGFDFAGSYGNLFCSCTSFNKQ